MSNSRIETAPVFGTFRLTGDFRSMSLSVSAVPDLTEATLTISGNGPRAAEMVAATQVHFDGSTLQFEAPERSVLGMMTQIRLSATIPTGADVEVRGQSGSCDFTGDLHVVDVRSHSGSIRMDRATQCFLKTTSGSIRLNAASGTVRAAATSGSIVIRRFEGGTVEAHATSGSVKIGIPFGIALNADASATSGRVTSDLQSVAGPEGFEGTLDAFVRTSSGSITFQRVA